ncbi:putative D-amino acid oxidase [Bisporella sp. PMI_857]|nr:putative D-amino acid oxidase [Bisporella sp. PMI_857]
MARDSIVVLGAGIIGINVALELSKRGYGDHITVVAQHMPGDQSINYTSPWAGANFSAISGNDANALRWDQGGYLTIWAMIEAGGPEAKYLKKTPSTEYFDVEPDSNKIASMKKYLKDLVILPPSSLPQGVKFGITFTTITINAPAHCAHLVALLKSQGYGSIPFQRRRVASVQDAFLSSNTRVVFNCVGGAASKLVNDAKSYPTRGQVLLVKAPQVTQSIMRHGRDYETYVIPRPNSGGNVILGGYMQKGNSSPDVYADETESILARTRELLPALGEPQTELLAAAAGLRPSREGGARVEAESLADGKLVVHNYGAGGTGYQAGMGMANDAVDRAVSALAALRTKAKL